MKMAKATKEDIDNMRLFYQVLEAYFRDGCEYKSMFDHFSDSELERIKTVFNSEDELDFHELCSLGYNYLLNGFFRIHFGYEVLLDNACDDNQDTLEFKPWISKSIEVLSEINEYIDVNSENYIGFDSELHKKVKQVLHLHEQPNLPPNSEDKSTGSENKS